MGMPIGYTMRFVKNTHPLVQLFTKAFKQRNGLSPEKILVLVKELQETVSFIHAKGILIVDLNEMNFLVEGGWGDVYAIDVNSYQTPSFPATVLMPSVKDHHAKKFSEVTDWYSWGIVAFQMLVGIHPYKGNHPDFDSTPMDSRMEARMKANVSVFNSKTKIPKACEPLDSIPSSLKSWFESVFENGNRTNPPLDYEAVILIAAPLPPLLGKDIDIRELAEYDDSIIHYVTSYETSVVITAKSVHVNKNSFAFGQKNVFIAFTPTTNIPILAWLEAGSVKLFNITRTTDIPITSSGNALLVSGGRLYIQNGTEVVEMRFLETGNRIVPTVSTVGQVLDLPEATKVFEGVILQNLLGRQVASIFPGSGVCQQVSLLELDGYQIIDAQYENGVLVVVGHKSGNYDRLVFRFDGHYRYDCRLVAGVAYQGINMTVSDAGVCVLLDEEERLELFRNVKDGGSVKLLEDPVIGSDMMLYHDRTKIFFARGNKLYQISVINHNR